MFMVYKGIWQKIYIKKPVFYNDLPTCLTMTMDAINFWTHLKSACAIMTDSFARQSWQPIPWVLLKTFFLFHFIWDLINHRNNVLLLIVQNHGFNACAVTINTETDEYYFTVHAFNDVCLLNILIVYYRIIHGKKS